MPAMRARKAAAPVSNCLAVRRPRMRCQLPPTVTLAGTVTSTMTDLLLGPLAWAWLLAACFLPLRIGQAGQFDNRGSIGKIIPWEWIIRGRNGPADQPDHLCTSC